MKKQTSFSVPDSSSFCASTENYFSTAGFKKINKTATEISFSKGSALSNMFTFNPLNWKSVVKITLREGTAIAEFDINTVGQLVTANEEKLWDTFIENYQVSITKGLDVTNENDSQLKETKKDSLKYIKWAFVGAFAFGVPFGFLAFFTGIDTLAPMGAAFGAVYFVTSKVNKERKKNRI